MVINGYELEAELQNANSGFSKWGFATKYGKEYFIKELITPVYPMDRSVMSDEVFDKRRADCVQYEDRFRKYYSVINDASCGNLVRVAEFFRSGSRYYVITEKINEKPIPVEQIAALPMDKKLLLLKTVANGFYKLHGSGIVHFDVKPANILIKRLPCGNYTAKLIDFDAGFFLGEDIENSELGGDLTYLAPETFLGMYGEDVRINEKADIFALGLVFHQYCTAELPSYDTSEYAYPYESVLDDAVLTVNTGSAPEELRELIVKMLDVDPAKRPSAEDIFTTLNEITGTSVDMEAIRTNDHGYTMTVGTYAGGSSGSRLKGTMMSSFRTSNPHSGPSEFISSGAGIESPKTSASSGGAPAPSWFKSAGDL